MFKRNILENLHECEKCGRIYESENASQKICEYCTDPEFAKRELEKLKKSKYLKSQLT